MDTLLHTWDKEQSKQLPSEILDKKRSTVFFKRVWNNFRLFEEEFTFCIVIEPLENRVARKISTIGPKKKSRVKPPTCSTTPKLYRFGSLELLPVIWTRMKLWWGLPNSSSVAGLSYEEARLRNKSGLSCKIKFSFVRTSQTNHVYVFVITQVIIIPNC